MLAATGSRMNAAISPGKRSKASSSAPRVVVRDDDGQRGDLVRDARAAGDPERRDARARRRRGRRRRGRGSPPSVLTIRARPVAARASRTALIVASVPELTKRTISTDGTIRVTRSASRTSSSVGAPKDVPRRAARDERPPHERRRVPEEVRPVGHDVVDVGPPVGVADARAAPRSRRRRALRRPTRTTARASRRRPASAARAPEERGRSACRVVRSSVGAGSFSTSSDSPSSSHRAASFAW